MAIEMVEDFERGTVIKVIGVGGGGGNAVEHMIARNVQGVEFICANTDAQALSRSSSQHVIQLGDSGLGAGADPQKGKLAAEEAIDRIREAIDGANMLFITAGMGGGTGTGATPVIARVAKEMGILTVGVVTKPFDFEGNRRIKSADNGVAELEANVDSLIVILNDKLLEVLGDDVTQEEAFAEANDVLRNAVGGISDIIHIPGLVNVDFEDVKTVMSEPGKAMMGTASASGPDRANKAAEAAVACPLLEGIDLSGARGVLVLIAASRHNFKLSESRNAMNCIRRYAADDAHVIYGTAYDETLADQLRVTVIATGLSPVRRQQQPTMTVVTGLRTGTDNQVHQHHPANHQAHQQQVHQQVSQPMQQAREVMPVAAQAAAAVEAASARMPTDYAQLQTPSVWRTGRDPAAAKVDALSRKGMEEFEIPAFLRKQAD